MISVVFVNVWVELEDDTQNLLAIGMNIFHSSGLLCQLAFALVASPFLAF